MIIEIRDYLDQKIKEIDSDYVFDGYIFDNDFSSSNNIDNVYKLVIGSTNPRRLDVINEATVGVDVYIFRISGTNRVKDFDSLYCRAIQISSVVTNQVNISQNDYIKAIETVSITPEQVSSDLNSISFKISFNVTVIYSLEV